MTGGDRGNIHVLVVDDEADIRATFAEILRSAGYQVTEAEDGFVALERLRSASVAVMVLDLNMPVLDGWQLLDQLDDPPPVILVTAHDHGEVMGFESKIGLYLQKPVRPESLLDAVVDAIKGRAET
jgi:CheY-like chemotaxis protein